MPAIAVAPVKSNVADLPACNAARFGAIASITDGNGATDCTVGGSTTDVACECNGSAWTARYTSTADTSAYVLITKAGQQAITASGAGNDITLTSADDLIFASADFLPTTTGTFVAAVGTTASITTTAGPISLTAGGTTQDITLTSVDDVILAATDDTTVAGDQLAVNTTTIVLDAGGGADEVSIAAGSVTVTGSLVLPIASAPPAACAAGTKGAIYYDSDINKLCICNATAYVLVDDATTTTGCS
jgi:hypothetical protein